MGRTYRYGVCFADPVDDYACDSLGAAYRSAVEEEVECSVCELWLDGSPLRTLYEHKPMFVYSFDLSRYEAGEIVATRFPSNVAVGGDWVCIAESDAEAADAARNAALHEWAAPDTREHDDFEIEFEDSFGH